MIIQCDHCSAKFRMDDAKLANGPVKVRCAKCKEVFVVRKDEEPEESFQLPTDFGAAPTTPAPAVLDQGERASAPEGFAGGSGEFSFDRDEFSLGETAPAPATSGASESDEFDWQSSTGYAVSGSHEEFGKDLMAGVGTTVGSAATGQVDVSAPGEFDFSDFPQSEQSLTAPTQVSGGVAATRDDFALDFGEVSFSETPSSETAAVTDFEFAPDAAAAAAGKDLSGDFGVSFDFSPSEAQAKSPAVEPAVTNAPFGDFDFGEIAEPHGLTPPKPSFPVPDAFATGQVFGEEFAPLPQQEDEIPPSSLTTRKKRGSLFPLFVIIGAIMLLVALVGSGVYFFGGPKVFSKVGLGFLVEWYGQKGSEEGDIVIRNVKAEYVVSKEAGELFVVRGEALNNYKKPRASIQVKVALLGSGGSTIKAKTAFCGNPLSNEQLTSLPFAKIEEVMNNQFGDSLANLGVKPGNAIPFVLVMNEIPKEAIDYSVQVSGSTVATQ